MKIWGYRQKAVTYASNPTRFESLDRFLGGAHIQEVNDGMEHLPIDRSENLEARFNSGVNRTDCPRMWGHPSVDRKLGNTRLLLADELASYRRNKGEPVWKK